MIIKDIKITNFGKFHNKEMSFDKGMNIIYGENEAGKTTIHTFIRGMLFGIEKQRGRAGENDTYTKYQPWDNPLNYCGTMRIENDGITYRIERNFNKDNKSCSIVREDIGKELSQDEIDKLFEGLNENCYYNTISISQLGGATDKELETILKNYAANLGSTKSTELDMKAAVDELKAYKKNIISAGKLDDKKRVQKEKNEIVEELQISEQEQVGIQETICSYEEKLSSLSLEQTEINRIAKEQNEIIIANEVKKETLSGQKQGLEKEVQSAKNSKTELEYNAKNLGKFIDKQAIHSLDDVDKAINKAKKKSKISIMSFLFAVIFAGLTGAKILGAGALLRKYIPELYEILPHNIPYGHIFAIAAMAMVVVWIISVIAHGAFRKRRLASLSDLREDIETMQQLEHEIEVQQSGLTEKQKQLDETTHNLNAIEKQIADMPKYQEDIKRLGEEINSINLDISKLQWELEQKKKEDAKNSSRLEETIRTIEEMESAEQEAMAIDIALDNIADIASEVRQNFGERLNQKASEHIKAITGGKYDNIVIDDNLNIRINKKDRLIKLHRMSKGTVEQIYMALRLAAAEILFENDRKPILMDDAFAMYDNKRMANTMEYMNNNVEQIILFSCHTREKVMADRLGLDYKLIKL